MSTKGRETPRLNMEHGFMQSIIKNQVDRDEYDKEQKLLKLQNKPGGPSRRERPKRAAMQVYVPPHLRQKGTQKEKEQGTASKPTSTSPSGELWPCFTLVCVCMIHHNSNWEWLNCGGNSGWKLMSVHLTSTYVLCY